MILRRRMYHKYIIKPCLYRSSTSTSKVGATRDIDSDYSQKYLLFPNRKNLHSNL